MSQESRGHPGLLVNKELMDLRDQPVETVIGVYPVMQETKANWDFPDLPEHKDLAVPWACAEKREKRENLDQAGMTVTPEDRDLKVHPGHREKSVLKA